MKRPVTISVEEDDYLVLKHLCELMGMTMSKLFEDTIKGYVLTAKAARIMDKKKLSKLDVVRFFGQGAKLDPLT